MALSLLERLEDFRAEVVPLTGECFRVLVELDGDPGAQQGLDRIESWLQSVGLNPAEVRLDDRSYRVSSPGSPLGWLDDSETARLVCSVKAIAVGNGVQVVSAVGELDLHTAPQVDDLLLGMDAGQVILDLTETTLVDSTTLSIIVSASKRIAREGRRLLVVAGNPTVARVLTITGLERALTLHGSLAGAIENALGSVVEAAGNGWHHLPR